MKKTIGLSILALFLFSCATTPNTTQRISSKVVYSLMVKDGHGIEANFSEELKAGLKGDMVLKALAAVEKQKGELEGIEFLKDEGMTTFYDIHKKKGNAKLKLVFNKKNQLEEVWIDQTPLMQKS